MSVYVFKLPKYHKEVFGDDRPRSYYFILSKLFDFWEMHPLRPEFVSLHKFSGVNTEVFNEKYVEETIISDSFTGIAPGWHFESGIHKSWQLIKWLDRDKMMQVPLVMYFGVQSVTTWKSGHVYEGHHRAGAANRLGWRTFPVFKLFVTHTEPGFCEMTPEDRTEMGKIQDERGLPNTSRIHGVKIAMWTEPELRQFMFPRKEDVTKFGIQNMITTKCLGKEYPEWQKFGDKPIKLNAGHGVFKEPEVLEG